MLKKILKTVLSFGLLGGVCALVSFKAPQGDAFLEAARAYSAAAKRYQETDVGARQFRLRYMLRDLYVNCPEREKHHDELFALGADLRRRIEMKWGPKIALGNLKVDPARPATPEQLLAVADIYANYWASPEHQKEYQIAKNLETMRRIQSEARRIFEEGGSLSETWASLEREGFSKDDIGDKRVYTLLEDLFSEWEAGRDDYRRVFVS